MNEIEDFLIFQNFATYFIFDSPSLFLMNVDLFKGVFGKVDIPHKNRLHEKFPCLAEFDEPSINLGVRVTKLLENGQFAVYIIHNRAAFIVNIPLHRYLGIPISFSLVWLQN